MEIQREVRKFIAPVIHWLYVIEKTNIKKTWSIIIHKIEWCSKKGQWLRKTEKVENSGRIKPSSRQGRHGKELSVCVWGGGNAMGEDKEYPWKSTERTTVETISVYSNKIQLYYEDVCLGQPSVM